MRSFIGSAALVIGLITLVDPSSACAQVCHRGTISETSTRWETMFFGPATFVGPLPSDVTVERVEGGTLVTDARGVVGVERSSPEAILLVTRQTMGGEPMSLHPPLVPGAQRVVLTTESHELVAFTPEHGSAVEGYVGYHASSTIGEDQRRLLDSICGPGARGAPLYVDASSYDDLRGRIASGADRRNAVLAITAMVLAAGLVVGVLAYRRLATRAQVEHVDALLDRRFRELDERAQTANDLDRSRAS